MVVCSQAKTPSALRDGLGKCRAQAVLEYLAAVHMLENSGERLTCGGRGIVVGVEYC